MKVCLVGSTRFMDQFNAANIAFTLAGHTVYTVAQSNHGDFIPPKEDKEFMDLVHLNKILESDMVIVVGRQEDGTIYIGESTRKEIMWANLQEIKIGFWDLKFTWKDIQGPRADSDTIFQSASETTLVKEEREKEHHRRAHEHFEAMGLIPEGSADRCDSLSEKKVN